MRSAPLAVAFFLVACGGGGSNDPYVTKPERGIVREVILVPGTTPDPNPVSNASTPPELNNTQVVRYRVDADPPIPARAIMVMMPGFLAGASTFDGLARTLVRRGEARGEIVEVWAIDRRSNQLEDVTGLEEAERRRDPEIAAAYYREGAEIDGRVFEGFLQSANATFMSEWGLATHLEDLRKVIELVPADARQGRVFLLGHSLGASFAELFAAWRFEDGVRGAELVAGVVLVDGILGGTPSAESAYVDGSDSGLFPTPGLTALRTGSVYTQLPLLGTSALINAEIAALRAHFDPEGIVQDSVQASQIAILIGGATVPAFTNIAGLGLAFDAQYQPLFFVRASIGELSGGPTEQYTSLFGGMLERPSDPTATYTWVEGDDAGEPSSAAELAFGMVHGRSNLSEWYFPSRISIDVAACGGAAIPEVGYQADAGLRAFDGPLTDAPILCIPAGLVGDVAACESVRARVAQVLGAGRPMAGSGRGAVSEDVPGFGIVDVTTFAHIDPVLARDEADNPVPGRIEAFLDAHAVAGALAIPRVDSEASAP